MGKSYVIHWKSNVNGRTGVGTIFFDREEAEALAAELNEDYPEIKHEAKSAAPAEEPANPAPLPPAELSPA
jgi:hypothetical protein